MSQPVFLNGFLNHLNAAFVKKILDALEKMRPGAEQVVQKYSVIYAAKAPPSRMEAQIADIDAQNEEASGKRELGRQQAYGANLSKSQEPKVMAAHRAAQEANATSAALAKPHNSPPEVGSHDDKAKELKEKEDKA
jgi:hypothetical protein